MKAYAIALIVCGSVAALALVLCCLCKCGRKKKEIKRSYVTHGVRTPLPPCANNDVERGEKPKSSTPSKDGDMVVLGDGGDVVATAADDGCISRSGGRNDGGGGGGGGRGRGGGGGGGGGIDIHHGGGDGGKYGGGCGGGCGPRGGGGGGCGGGGGGGGGCGGGHDY
ncbi:hypothetical protein Acr_17g0008570 [Actinidia rufa]|uniref:Glycine-rich protein n=1 Tax=Actinidia rufa TaxID=165716 RepID=A0A7J0G3C2_9ERIC|nr:hypothetical protein Acr_17g0008570 [Actinidia rufa]